MKNQEKEWKNSATDEAQEFRSKGNVKQIERVTLTDEEERWCMDTYAQMKGKKASEFTAEQKKAIVMGGRCTNRDVCAQASYVVYVGLNAFVCKMTKRMEISPKSHIYKDILQDVYETIVNKLYQWDPNVSDLITFFTGHIRNCIIAEKNFADEQLGTRYYNEVTMYIKKAKNDFQLKGNPNPSNYEIRNWIYTHYNQHYSDKAIQECQKRGTRLLPYDGLEMTGAPTSAAYFSPETLFIENVDTPNEVRRTIASLESHHRLYLLAKLNLYERNTYTGDIPLREIKEEFIRLVAEQAISQYPEDMKTPELYEEIYERARRVNDNFIKSLRGDSERAFKEKVAKKLDIHEKFDPPIKLRKITTNAKALARYSNYKMPTAEPKRKPC